MPRLGRPAGQAFPLQNIICFDITQKQIIYPPMAEEITMNSKSLEVKRHFIKDKIIIGIDPAKHKRQAKHYGFMLTPQLE